MFRRFRPSERAAKRERKKEAALLAKVRPYTFCSDEKLRNLRRLALELRDKGIEGDIVECGTYRGGSAAILGTTLSPHQHLWLYDSFAGMPPVGPNDGPEAAQYVGKGVASAQDVREVLALLQVRPEQCVIRPGWFSDSFQQALPEKVALLHCDADWYDSVMLVLETFYPRVAEGGCIVLDDFGYWEGCREAFYAFCGKHQLRPLLERRSIDQAYWFKGRTNNRVPLWSQSSEFDDAWKERIATMASYIRKPCSVMDFGCGQMWLEPLLPPGCTYLPLDYIRRDERTLVVDLNRDPLPAVKADVAFLSGVLEYVEDIEGFAARLTAAGFQKIILSYCLRETIGGLGSRKELNWVCHKTLPELLAIFLPNYDLAAIRRIKDNTILV
ncbi:MAG: TylF/MycF/NovP-related O-methyltransferase [Verrucomicrobiota bacterium]